MWVPFVLCAGEVLDGGCERDLFEFLNFVFRGSKYTRIVWLWLLK